MSILDRNNFCRLHNRLCIVYRNYVHCNTILFALARSRGYGVHKAHSTGVAACTARTHGPVAQ